MLVALLPRPMTNSKFWHKQSRAACCPVAHTYDDLHFVVYTFKTYLLPCCPDIWRLKIFVIYVIFVALFPRLTRNSKFWHIYTRTSCYPVAQNKDQFKILANTVESCLLPCCPEQWRRKLLVCTFRTCLLPCCPGQWQLTNFDIYIREEHVALLPRLTTN